MKKRSLLKILCCIPAITCASHVAPIATGNWFTNAKLSSVNACGRPDYQYEQLTTDAKTLANNLLPAPNDSRCAKTPLISTPLSQSPNGFIGTITDWQNLSASSSNSHSTRWTRQCLSTDGKLVFEKSITLHPQYQCPKGSRYDVSDENGVGCDTTPKSCMGDVVAHDLFFKSIYFFGHIGLTGLSKIKHHDHPVLEIIDKPENRYDELLHEDTLARFKTHRYWGEKYGTHRAVPFTLNQGLHILLTGLEQEHFNPSYTFFWNPRPGRYQPHYVYDFDRGKFLRQYAITQARFRCDSFVNYTYEHNGLSIVDNYSFPHHPLSLFAALKHDRTPDSDARGLPTDDPELYVDKINEIINRHTDNSDAPAPDPNAPSFMDDLNNFLGNSTVDDNTKANKLWETAKELQNDPERMRNMLGGLLTLRPIKLADELTAAFLISKNVEIKYRLLEIISESFRINTLADAQDFSDEDLDKLYGAQFLLQQILKTDQDRFITREAFMHLMATLPSEQAWEAFDALLARHADFFSEKEIANYKVAMAFSTPEMQTHKLPMLLAAANGGSATLLHDTADAVYTMLRYMKVKDINNDVRDSLQQFIIMHAPRDDLDVYSMVDALAYYDWLRAYVALFANNDAERADMMTSIICRVHSPTLLGLLVLISGDHLLERIGPSERARLSRLVKANMDNANIVPTEKMFQQAVLAKLTNHEGTSDDGQLPDPDF